MDPGICVRLFAEDAKGVIQHDDGYAVAKFAASALATGDELEANWLNPGRHCIRNVTRGDFVEVVLLGNWGTPFGAIRACGG